MPPRFAYWTIIAGGLPTAFRAAEREELLPTFRRIQEKHPDAVMKYFARGALWESQDDAQRAAEARRGKSAGNEPRGRDWRPGGEHRDPRQKFKDAKKDRNLEWRKRRFERRHGPPDEKPHGDPLREVSAHRPGDARSSAAGGSRKRTPVRSWKGGTPPPKRNQTGAWKAGAHPADRKPAVQPGKVGARPADRSDRPADRKGAGRPWKGGGSGAGYNGTAKPWQPGTPGRRKSGGANRERRPGAPPRDRRRRG